MKIKVANYISNFVVEHGVKHVFLVPGGGAMHLDDALGHDGRLKCIFNHHEQASAIAAESYCRLTGEMPLVCVTSGPGGTNALTGVLCAWLDSIPMFVISGQVKRETTIWSTDVPLRQIGDQEYNIIDSVAPMTKYTYMITDENEIRYHLEKAWYLAQNGRGGPVWLDIPLDIQGAMVETDMLKGFDPTEIPDENPVYDESLTPIILKKIQEAKRPVIFAGTGIRLGKAREEFLAMVDKLHIPVVTEWNAHDVIWDDHPCYCGRPGTIGTRGGNFIVENSDLLLILGSRLNIRQISYNYRDFAKNAYQILVDIDKNELRKPTISPDLPIWANVKDVVNSLLASDYSSGNPDHYAWLKWCREIDARYPAVLPRHYNKKSPMNPYPFIRELYHQLDENETVTTGNGSACVISFQAGIIKKGTRLFTNSGCATMGYGFPSAMGECVALGNKRVICIDGDGSFQMNLQELQTAVYNKLNIKLFYLNNHGYHSMRQTQSNLFQPPFVGVNEESGISFPDIGKIAAAYGIPFYRVDNIDEASTIIEKTLETEGLVICEAMLDPEQFFEPKLSSKVLPDGKIVSPPIDDMYPFLSKEEYEMNKDMSKMGK